jgi:hypothetical protein
MERNDIPYIAFEAEMARHEREKFRLVKALIISIIITFISNMAWLWFFNQFDVIGNTVQLESNEAGNASYMGGSGVIDNGRSESQHD